jgi:hypothetical protein
MTPTRPAAPQSKAASVGEPAAPATRRIGYGTAILVNAVMLYLVNNVLGWDVAPFLTDEFTRVLPIVNVSLVASIVANAVYLGFDRPWFKSLTQVGLLGISMAAMARIYDVFPFDFSAYRFPWAGTARVLLVIGIVGAAFGIVAEVIKGFVRLARS